MKFLGQIAATIIGLFLFCMIAFFGIVIIGAIFGGQEETVSIKDDSVIEMDLSDVKLDYAGRVNFSDFNYFKAEHNGVIDVINAIEYAKTDSKIKGITLVNPANELGIAQVKAIHDALIDFKKSGKFIYAYGDYFSQKDYYLCAPATRIVMNPVGEMDFKGIAAELMFFKDLQDKAGIKMEVIRHGKYKSAVEPFLENGMSEANREQMTTLLQSLWNAVATDLCADRRLSLSQLNDIAATMGARTPQKAKAVHLIDQIAYEDQFNDLIRKELKVKKDEKIHSVSITDYANHVATTPDEVSTDDTIAIVYAQGEISSGEGDVNVIAEGAMRRALKKAREDDDVKAVVLRVNSPGGSALTSELIWRELELTKKVKPLIVSMGDYAASGGYYISCNADKIFAEKSTITGSIGVFGIFPNAAELSSRMGIHSQVVSTHPQAAEYSPFRPIDPFFKAYAQESVERTYTIFANRVAVGRKITFAQVDAIGQGRVWSGADALKIGLVDAIGGLNDAIKEAAKRAKISKYHTQDYPEYEKSLSDLFQQMGLPFAKTSSQIIEAELGKENYRNWTKLKKWSQQKGIQARLPFEIQF